MLTLKVAQDAAAHLVRALHPTCERIQVAGSIRREQQTVNDIEIVCRPLIKQRPKHEISQKKMFDQVEPEQETVNLLEMRIEELLEKHPDRIALCKEKPSNGPCHKRLVMYANVVARQNEERVAIPVDLNIVSPGKSWGWMLALRTGSERFCHLLVTEQQYGGARPWNVTLQDGCVFVNRRMIEADTEEKFFEVLGVPCFEPRQRTEQNLRRHLERGRPMQSQFRRTRRASF